MVKAKWQKNENEFDSLAPNATWNEIRKGTAEAKNFSVPNLKWQTILLSIVDDNALPFPFL